MLQETVTWADGIRIAYWRSGEGRPLVLVHGTAADHGRWRAVLPAFEERFSSWPSIGVVAARVVTRTATR